MLLPALFLIAAAVGAVALWRLAAAVDGRRRDAAVLGMLRVFAPAAAAAQLEPAQLLAWYPIAQHSRRLFPAAFAALDDAFGGRFPFGPEQLETAHARFSADWLSWERAHDAAFALKQAQIEDEIARAGGQATPLHRTRLAALDREKLETYQQRYQEYVRASKALAALNRPPAE